MATIDHVVEVEIDLHLDEDRIDTIMDGLASHHVALTEAPSGNATVILTIPAADLAAAAKKGVSLARRHGAPLTVSAIAEELRDAREDLTAVGERIGVAEAADIIGVTPAYVRRLIANEALPGERVGARTYSVARADVQAYARRRRSQLGPTGARRSRAGAPA